MPDDPIAVTGLGIWCAAGISPSEVWSNVVAGRSCATLWSGPELPRPVAVCRAPEPPPVSALPQARRMDRSVRLALAAAFPAFAEARLDTVDPARIAILVGNSRGPVEQWNQPAPARPRPTRVAHTAIASLSGALSLALRVRGPCLTVSATCASAAHALALGALLLRSGAVDAVLAGGAEAPLHPALLRQFEAAQLLSRHPEPHRACRPFASDRDGIVPAEGAAFLVLETSAAATRRGVSLHGHLLAARMGAESFNRVATRPDGAGLASLIELALGDSGLRPHDICHVNAHGTGTQLNDAAEAAAFERVFGPSLADGRPAISSTKPVTGHAFGAAAAIEAIVTLLALRHRLAPPTAGSTGVDPAFAFPPVLGQPRPLEGRHALSTSLGFWGNNAALLFADRA